MPAFVKAGSDERFARALTAARRQETGKPPRRPIVEIKDATGQAIAEIRASERDVKVTLAKHTGSAFAQFLTAPPARVIRGVPLFRRRRRRNERSLRPT